MRTIYERTWSSAWFAMRWLVGDNTDQGQNPIDQRAINTTRITPSSKTEKNIMTRVNKESRITRNVMLLKRYEWKMNCPRLDCYRLELWRCTTF